MSTLCKYANYKIEALYFTSSEQAVITALLQAIVSSAVSSAEPVIRLSTGLGAAGFLALGSITAALRLAVSTFQSVAIIKWNFD